MRIGILGGQGRALAHRVDDAVRRLGAELARRCWGMVFGIPRLVASDTIGPGLIGAPCR